MPEPLTDRDKELVMIPRWWVHPTSRNKTKELTLMAYPWQQIRKTLPLWRRIKLWFAVKYSLLMIYLEDNIGGK